MKYKYVIRKFKTDDNDIKYVPLVLTNGYWRYLIKTNDRFLASKKNKTIFDKPIDAYKFIATHRIAKGSKGKNRFRCMYYKEGLSFAPLLGILYLIKGFTSGIPLKFLFANPISMGAAIGLQAILLLLLLMIL